MEKPLVTAILIRKFEQPVCYEGILKLCFSCGRVGHRKENCPYAIRHDAPQGEVDAKEAREGEARACKDRVLETTELGVGTNKDVHESEHENVQEETYGPWIVVVRRKNGTKNQRSGGPLSALDNG